jgi:hypothetical protein
MFSASSEPPVTARQLRARAKLMREIASGMVGHTIASLLIRRASEYEAQAELIDSHPQAPPNKSENEKPLNSGP